jgi:hypothetical protein
MQRVGGRSGVGLDGATISRPQSAIAKAIRSSGVSGLCWAERLAAAMLQASTTAAESPMSDSNSHCTESPTTGSQKNLDSIYSSGPRAAQCFTQKLACHSPSPHHMLRTFSVSPALLNSMKLNSCKQFRWLFPLKPATVIRAKSTRIFLEQQFYILLVYACMK